jgi:hypothetical protein
MQLIGIQEQDAQPCQAWEILRGYARQSVSAQIEFLKMAHVAKEGRGEVLDVVEGEVEDAEFFEDHEWEYHSVVEVVFAEVELGEGVDQWG